jgi:transglutaminase-like putative cysteine protease
VSKVADYQIPRSALGWMLLSVLLVMLPQSLHMPFWVTFLTLVCIAWRWLIFTGVAAYPGRLLRIAIVVFTMTLSVSQMRSSGIGLDSAASLLALGFVFKLIEMRHKRDVYVVISLCFIMAMVNFLYSQSVVATIYTAIVIIVITCAMLALNRSHLHPGGRGNLRLATVMALQALPLTIVLFVMFPRIAPLWAVPMQNSSGTTGVSDEMTPGDLAQLGRSSELAFRVQFEDSLAPLHQDLYWRGLVLEDFDGQTWRRTRRGSSYSEAASLNDFRWNWEDRVRLGNQALRYNVIIEPSNQPWLYGLHLAQPLNRELYQSRNFEIFNNGVISKRSSYDLISYRGSATDLILLDSARRRTTNLPGRGNEQSVAFAERLRAGVQSDRDYVYALLAHFQQNEFYYTLNPALLGEQRVDDFLFNTRQGFCEHYASSFAFLMRAVGIPARVVVGYQGAEYNPYENYMMVYQYNAHAWNEVWLEGEGWVRFDPTAAVSPERIEQGVEAALADDPAFREQSLFSAARLGSLGWVNALRLRLDAIEYEWNRRVVNYDEDVQSDFLANVLGDVTDQKVLFVLIALAFIATGAIALTVISSEPRSRRSVADSLYYQFGKELDKISLGRQRGEAPLRYRDRVCAAKPELAQLVTEATRCYMELNYHTGVRKQDSAGQESTTYGSNTDSLAEFRKVLTQLRFKLLPFGRLRREA